MNFLASLFSFFAGEGGIPRLIAVSGGVLLLCLLLAFWFYHRSSVAEIRDLRADNTSLRADLGQVIAANAAQQVAIQIMQNQQKINDAKVEQAAREIADKDKNVRSLSNQLRKAMHENDQFRTGLGYAVTNALCLQYLAYEGRLSDDYLGADPASAFDGRTDSVATFCRSWREATTEGLIIWIEGLKRQIAGFNVRVRAARGTGQ